MANLVELIPTEKKSLPYKNSSHGSAERQLRQIGPSSQVKGSWG